ncbi:hypothetical protein [Paraburkholderia sp. J41]|uniref:hypothetical protein n=1 Tax=Paraburkholderia sp. J41 TaxID=2805433 RepID=UPI002AC322B1|nr:hypothetical protein [Paraburkholderia sp. J41]
MKIDTDGGMNIGMFIGMNIDLFIGTKRSFKLAMQTSNKAVRISRATRAAGAR